MKSEKTTITETSNGEYDVENIGHFTNLREALVAAGNEFEFTPFFKKKQQ